MEGPAGPAGPSAPFSSPDQKLTFANVVKSTVFLTNLADFAGMNGAYETYLREHPEAANGDLVLTRLAFAYAAPRNPERDLVRATATLRRIVDKFPDSPWRPYAEYTLLDEIDGVLDRRAALHLAAFD